MDERQIIDTLAQVRALSQAIVNSLDNQEFAQAESELQERLALLQTIPPLQSLALSTDVFEQAVNALTEIEQLDSIGLKNASVQHKEIHTKLSAGVKAQKAILTYLEHKV